MGTRVLDQSLDPARLASRAEAIAALTAPGELFELTTLSIAGQPQLVFANAPASLRQLYEDNASDKPFIVYDDERLTFAEAWAEAARIAVVLRRDYGVGMFFLPQDTSVRTACERVLTECITAEGQTLLGWRDVPTNNARLGKGVKGASLSFQRRTGRKDRHRRTSSGRKSFRRNCRSSRFAAGRSGNFSGDFY